MSCQGKPIEMKDLRTQEQKDMMKALYPILLSGIQRGATPFGGMLSQPPDPSMLNAMNVMMQAGGQGPYTFPGFQAGGYPQPGQAMPPGSNYTGDYRKTNPYSGGVGEMPDWWWGLPDPYRPSPGPLPPDRPIVPV